MLCSLSSAFLLKWVAWLVNNRWRRQIFANKKRNSEGRNIIIHKQARISFLRLSTGFSCFSCTTYDIITFLIILHSTKKVRNAKYFMAYKYFQEVSISSCDSYKMCTTCFPWWADWNAYKLVWLLSSIVTILLDFSVEWVSLLNSWQDG